MNITNQSTLSNNDDSFMREDDAVSMHEDDASAPLRKEEDPDAPCSLVDVGLCFARQYGLEDLEEELLRDIDLKPSPATLGNALYRAHSDLRNTEIPIATKDC